MTALKPPWSRRTNALSRTPRAWSWVQRGAVVFLMAVVRPAEGDAPPPAQHQHWPSAVGERALWTLDSKPADPVEQQALPGLRLWAETHAPANPIKPNTRVVRLLLTNRGPLPASITLTRGKLQPVLEVYRSETQTWVPTNQLGGCGIPDGSPREVVLQPMQALAMLVLEENPPDGHGVIKRIRVEAGAEDVPSNTFEGTVFQAWLQGKSPGRLTLRRVEVHTGTRTVPEVSRTVGRRLAGLTACYVDWLRANRSGAAFITAHILVDGSGRVTAAPTTANGDVDAQVTACMSGLLQRVRFAQAASTTSATLVFHAQP